jgi:ABC-type enterochelin transport system ATPase subunit
MNNYPATVNQQGNPFRTKSTTHNNLPHQNYSGMKPITRDEKAQPNKTVACVYKNINKKVDFTDIIIAMRRTSSDSKEA